MIRKAIKSDINSIVELYKETAKVPDGIARTVDEINHDLITEYFEKSAKQGLMLVAQNPNHSEQLIAAIHCYKFDPKVFSHTFGNLVLVVHPQFHGQGLGTKIFTHLLEEVKNNHPEVARVELFVRSGNQRAIALYQKLGFVIEGHLKNRIVNSQNQLESDNIMGWINPNYSVQNLEQMQEILKEINDFLKLTKPLELKPSNEHNDKLGKNSAVYIFKFKHKDEYLKVGKVNEGSQTRFSTQHYKIGKGLGSTLAKSILSDKVMRGEVLNDSENDCQIFVDELVKKNCDWEKIGSATIKEVNDVVGKWIKDNTERFNIFMPKDLSNKELLNYVNFVEAFFILKLSPKYEGKTKSQS